MENKNTVIALVLMLAVWLGFSFLFPSQEPAPETVGQPQAQTSTAVDFAPSKQDQLAVPPVAMPEPVGERVEVVVENDLFRAVLSNAGGVVTQFELKNFKETTAADSPNIRVLDLPPGQAGSLQMGGSGNFSLDPRQLYAVGDSRGEIKLSGDEEARVVFSTTTAGGLVVEKIYTFAGNSYAFDLKVRVANQGNDFLRGNLELTLVHPWDEETKGDRFSFHGPSTLVGDKLVKDEPEDLAQDGAKSYGEARWSAFETKYFMSALVPLDGAGEQLRVALKQGVVENGFSTPQVDLRAGEGAEYSYLAYFGPRDLDILQEVDHELARAIDFGFFTVVATPLLHALKFFYGYIGNYGIAIILITVILKLIFWPLTQKSYTSMKAMQKLQPEMAKLREKFKNDKQKLNMELMQLYKQNRVNPLGGCLPMLIQIPVFFALYKVLMDTIDLRHAPFALWLTDLSAKDPYYITPLIMGATMFIQQKMTPSTMDPAQAKMFMLMPVIFTFLFLNFPSGLVIYWLVNNLLTILQQYLIKRQA
ncbi:membrane protein insertase YidC [Desulfuromonas versatilis]|uniref:Membrane protein insertase YidC n=1 Tax=Desulfuromonas versatilis TaxID=2802975 RepID=A0ABN6DRP7_9BACT|nr:membrane protein insertase YidC [Desulfuromonas versatilis]BCR02943.1 membrane protein insertase YidC [Desulfuromonas versatilis]